eukprot:6022444-Alexandrium_andersonii.AAC.1
MDWHKQQLTQGDPHLRKQPRRVAPTPRDESAELSDLRAETLGPAVHDEGFGATRFLDRGGEDPRH